MPLTRSGRAPTAVQTLAVRDAERLATVIVGTHRHCGRDVRGTATGDDHGGQTRGGRRAQPRGRPRDRERILRGYPEFPQCGLEGLGIRHGLLDVVGGDHRLDEPSPTSCRTNGSAQLRWPPVTTPTKTPAVNASMRRSTSPGRGARSASSIISSSTIVLVA